MLPKHIDHSTSYLEPKPNKEFRKEELVVGHKKAIKSSIDETNE